MKITIDTKEDSKEEIKKVIGMLSALVGGGRPVYTNSQSFPSSSFSESSIPKQHHANIFSDEPKEESSSSSSESEPSNPSGSIFGNIFGPVSSEPSSSAGSDTKVQSSEPEEPEKKPEIQIIDY